MSPTLTSGRYVVLRCVEEGSNSAIQWMRLPRRVLRSRSVWLASTQTLRIRTSLL